MMGSSAVEKLFSRPLPVTAKFAEREERKQTVLITLEMHSITSPIHTKELVVRLTDETDLFFLYTLRLNEEDFQSLKVQQGLLVDFSAFPQRFVDLLELCLQEQHKESPK
ncbi:spindle assembly abnormal protein 6 homolog [Lingula anatina]|uniref:Spindle assembly abnormal protein 6 homolog n=1 Tax=Lingula anatina TaxID=7574 RepID=A0A1S3JEY2_LINAN|nr:spindle assembly abnormal protein 6 homolog [Lingula anatina]|eukprot:XP_013408706.2 spindle assembly abnormal protein 6 homolog [Lingula anatina]